jgi:hypothetical protein
LGFCGFFLSSVFSFSFVAMFIGRKNKKIWFLKKEENGQCILLPIFSMVVILKNDSF